MTDLYATLVPLDLSAIRAALARVHDRAALRGALSDARDVGEAAQDVADEILRRLRALPAEQISLFEARP